MIDREIKEILYVTVPAKTSFVKIKEILQQHRDNWKFSLVMKGDHLYGGWEIDRIINKKLA